MTTTTKQYGLPGCNPFSLSGPVVSGSGVPALPFTFGSVASAEGDAAAEFIFCQLALAAPTTLTDGQAYTFDANYLASLVSTTNAPRGQEVGVGRVAQVNAPAGTYGIWLQRAGHVGVQENASVPSNALAETTATAGQLNATNTPTVGSKLIVGLYTLAAGAASAGPVVCNVAWPYIDKTN